MTSTNQTPGRYTFTPLVASQLWRANQHEPARFGLSSPWPFPSRSGILLHAVVQAWLSLCNDQFRHETFLSLLRRPALFLLVLGCSRRPLVGVDAKSSEFTQEIPHTPFPASKRSPLPPPIPRTSCTPAGSYPPCAPQILRIRSASCVKFPRCSHFPS